MLKVQEYLQLYSLKNTREPKRKHTIKILLSAMDNGTLDKVNGTLEEKK